MVQSTCVTQGSIHFSCPPVVENCDVNKVRVKIQHKYVLKGKQAVRWVKGRQSFWNYMDNNSHVQKFCSFLICILSWWVWWTGLCSSDIGYQVVSDFVFVVVRCFCRLMGGIGNWWICGNIAIMHGFFICLLFFVCIPQLNWRGHHIDFYINGYSTLEVVTIHLWGCWLLVWSAASICMQIWPQHRISFKRHKSGAPH